MSKTITYCFDFYGERPKGELVDMTEELVNELDAATLQQFETLDAALARLARDERGKR